MSLTLSDVDNFTLSEVDNFTLEELDSMSYTKLFATVQSKYQAANEHCKKNMPLSDEQIKVITSIVHEYMEEHGQDSLPKTLTVGVAINVIWAFLCFLTSKTIEHLPEITQALKQAYILLTQLIQQAQK